MTGKPKAVTPNVEAKKADIPLGKVGNTEYEVKSDGVYYQDKKLDNPENKTHRQLIEADIKRRKKEALDKANKQIEKTNKKEDRRVKVETYRTLDIGGNPVEVEITTNADGSRLLRARQVNEDGSIEPMAYITERINNKSQATLTNEKLVEGYIGNEDNTLERTNVDENPNQTHIDKINAKYNTELDALEQKETPSEFSTEKETSLAMMNELELFNYLKEKEEPEINKYESYNDLLNNQTREIQNNIKRAKGIKNYLLKLAERDSSDSLNDLTIEKILKNNPNIKKSC